MKKRIALVDGDEVAYSIAFRCQSKEFRVHREGVQLSRHQTKLDAIEAIENEEDLDIEEATVDLLDGVPDKLLRIKSAIINRVKFITTNSKSLENRIFLNGDDNFRYKFATLLPYKGDRVNIDRPIYLQIIKDIMKELGAISENHLESDDMMVVHSMFCSRAGFEPIICSSDKDLRTVPGWNYNIGKGIIKNISVEEAMFNFYYQLTIGDPTDNIPHPARLGEVSALRILDPYKGTVNELGYFEAVRKAYRQYLCKTDKSGNYLTRWYTGQDVDDILYEIGNLLYMRRTLNVDERWELPTRRQ